MPASIVVSASKVSMTAVRVDDRSRLKASGALPMGVQRCSSIVTIARSTSSMSTKCRPRTSPKISIGPRQVLCRRAHRPCSSSCRSRQRSCCRPRHRTPRTRPRGDRDRQVADIVPIRAADHLDQPDGRLAVAIGAELCHPAPAPSRRTAASLRYRSWAIATTSASARMISPGRSISRAPSSTGTRAALDDHRRRRRTGSRTALRRRDSAARGRRSLGRLAVVPCSRWDSAETLPGGAPNRGCASISSTCSSSGIARQSPRPREHRLLVAERRAAASFPRNRGAPSNRGTTASTNATADRPSRVSMSSRDIEAAAAISSPGTSSSRTARAGAGRDSCGPGR